MKLSDSYKQKKLTQFAQENRKKPTYAENKLWQNLRNRNFLGYKFRRQLPVLRYIVDFYCEKLFLVIEIDGSVHDETSYEYDKKRQSQIENLGLTVIRFTEYEVMKQFDFVLQTLENYVEAFTSSGSLHSPPSPLGEGI